MNTILRTIGSFITRFAFVLAIASMFFAMHSAVLLVTHTAPTAHAMLSDAYVHVLYDGGGGGCCGGFTGGYGGFNSGDGGGGGGGGGTPTPWCTLATIQPIVAPGGSSTLVWSSLNVTSLSIDNGVGAVTPVASGSIVVHPTTTTTYIAKGVGAYGNVTCRTTVTVTSPPPASCVLTAVPSTISSGDISALSWITNGLSNFTIDHGVGIVTPTAGGVTSVSPTVTTTYTGTGTTGQCTPGPITADPDGMYSVTGTTQPVTVTISDLVTDAQCSQDIYGWYLEDASGHPMNGAIVWRDTYVSKNQNFTKTFTAAQLAGVSRIGFFTIPSAGGAINHSAYPDGTPVTFVYQAVGNTLFNYDIFDSPNTLRWFAKTGAVIPPVTVFSNPDLNDRLIVIPNVTPVQDNVDLMVDNASPGNQNWFPNDPTQCHSNSCGGHVNLQVDVTTPGTCQTVQCQATITVTPPQNGCIQILKETFDTAGNVLTPVAQFTFKLDGNVATTQNDANGNAVFMNVTPGAHDVSEIIPNASWTQLSVTPTSGHVIVPSGAVCAAVVFKNKQVVGNPPPACTLTASPTTIIPGDTSTLSWTTINATSFSIDQGIGNLTPVATGQYVSSPTHTVTFTGTATGPGGTVHCDTTVTVTPPPPPPQCGLDIALVMDTSGSIGPVDLMNMKSAFNNFIDTLSPTPTMFSVSRFDTTASVLQAFTSNATIAKAGVNSASVGEWTNWEQGLIKGASTFDPRPNVPNVIVFASDGVPNRYGAAGTTGGNSGTIVDPASLNAAVAQANAIKAGGTRIITFGIGSALTPATLQQIASPGDYYTTTNFSTLGTTLHNLAIAMCGGTITVHKVIDADGNLETTNDQTPGSNWTFTVAGTDKTTNSQGSTMPLDVNAGTYSVSEHAQNGYTLVGANCTGGNTNGSLSGNTISGVQVGASSIVSCTFYNKPTTPPPGPGCIKVLKETYDVNGNILTPVAQFTFNLDSGAQTVQNDANGNAIFNNVSVGTHQVSEILPNNNWTQLSVTPNNGSVVVTAGTQCAAVVFKNKQVITNTPAPACTLSASASQISPGQSIILSWTSQNVTSGSINHSVGNTTPVGGGSIEVFPPEDTVYTGTFTGPYGTVTCTAPVTLIHPACTGACGGGGLDQPRVVLFQKPGDAPLAFVTLAQIPYTGFEAGFALTIAFWLAIGLIAAMVAYFVMGRGGLQTIVGGTLALVGAGQYMQMPPRDYARPMPRTPAPEPVETYTHEDSAAYSASVMAAPAPAPMKVMPVYAAPANDGIPELSDVIEARAHGAGVLMSPESVHMALELSADRAEALRKFGAILNEAVKTIPREDGWILLTSERFQELAKEVPASPVASMTTSPSVESIISSVGVPPVQPTMHITHSPNVEMPMSVGADQAVAMTLADAILTGDRDQAYATARTLEVAGANAASVMTVVATALDQLYRARRHGTTTELTPAAMSVPDESLANIVEAFAEGMDHGYTNPYTGLKLAIAQAFEARG